ncbi:hypothetical protein [Neptunicella sp. SCSIO 80796]|uniref:hypothetical protein n=1 Tax=Neptunicella plasticusilytica TaxID=3117012 RepID=UPI003A4D6AD1
MDLRIIFFALVMITTPWISHATQTDEQRILSQQLSMVAKEVNSKAPWALDADTRLDSAATMKNYIIYNNTLVNYTADQLDVAMFDSILEDSVIGKLCANKELRSFIDLKVIMVYRYLGKDGQFITELSKDMATCK